MTSAACVLNRASRKWRSSYRVPLILMHTRGTTRDHAAPALRAQHLALARGAAWKRPFAAPSPPGFAGRSSSSIPAWASASRAGKTTRFSPASQNFNASTFRCSSARRENPSCRRSLPVKGWILRKHRPGARYWPIAETHRNAAKRRHAAPQPNSALLLTGDAAVVVAAILGGAHIVRVHDPAAILPAVRVADALLAARR